MDYVKCEYLDRAYDWQIAEPGQEIGWGGVTRVSESDATGVLLPVSWGDYGGSIVDRSNYVDLLETYGREAFILVGSGGHDGQGLVLPLRSPVWDGVMADIAGLEEYPLLSDETMTTIEWELLDEAVESWLTHDVCRELGQDVTPDMVRDAISTLMHEGTFGYPTAETATDIYVDRECFDAIVAVLRERVAQ